MKKHLWKIVTAMRHWSAITKSDIITCEFCDAHATYSSCLVDGDDVVQELHWHCDPHGNRAIAILERTRNEDLTLVVQPRHWMHIWKVGFVRCKGCNNDSRAVATLIDEDGEVVSQTMYCDIHAPRPARTAARTIDPNDFESQMKFGLGFSIRPSDGSVRFAEDGIADE